VNLVPGMTYIPGNTPALGKRLLEACANLGIDYRVVRTQDSGFLVPDVVADEAERLGLPGWAEKEAVF
jgi:hypothetical protein